MLSGFRASDIGQYGIEDLSWWEGPAGVTFSPYDVGGGESPFYDIPFSGVWDAVISTVGQSRSTGATVLAFPSGTRIPQVQPDIIRIPAEPLLAADSGDEEVGESPTFEPGNEWYSRTAPTDWEKVYDAYEDLNKSEEEVVALDWGALAGSLLTQYAASAWTPNLQYAAAPPTPQTDIRGIQNVVGPPPSPASTAMAQGSCSPCPTSGPRYAKICIATGEVSPLRRRRRRRLLTAGDLSDIASLKALVGGGAALNAAVVKAMR